MLAYKRGHFVGTLSRSNAANRQRREGSREGPGTRENPGLKANKKRYDRSQYVVENKRGHIENEAKTNSN